MSDKEVASLQKQNANLRQEIQRLKASNASLRAEFNPVRDRLAQAEKMLNGYHLENKRMAHLYDLEIQTSAKLKKRISKLEHKIREMLMARFDVSTTEAMMKGILEEIEK